MSTSAISTLTNDKQQVVVKSVGLGLQLLPFFVTSIETLFGRKTGQTKKKAVSDLLNASIVGIAAGYGLAGSPDTGQMIASFQPLLNQSIDTIAATLYPSGTTVPQQEKSGS